MIEEMLYYLFTNRKYYDGIKYAKWNNSKKFLSIVKKYVDNSYVISEDDVYIFFSKKDADLPMQGWKIHVSTCLEDMDAVIDNTVKYIIDQNVSFKIIKCRELYTLFSQKMFPRENYGKLITIYPKNQKEFKKLIKQLYKILRIYKGPRILSDRRYKYDCTTLYYRYGGIKPICKLDSLGRLHTYICDDKKREIEDIRYPFYNLPEFVKDPFSKEKIKKSKLLKEYKVIEAIEFKNSGGIYRAEKDSIPYIIKEARPYTVLVTSQIDAVKLRQKEVEVLDLLKKEKCIPRLKDAFWDTEHFFLIEEYCEGETLNNYIMFNNSYLRKQGIDKIEAYIKSIIKIFGQLADFLARLEEDDIEVNDLTADNILICTNNVIKFIDLEGAGRNVEELAVSKHTSGKKNTSFVEFAKLLFYCIFGKGEILEIDISFFEVFWQELLSEYIGATDTLYNISKKLVNGEYSKFRNVSEVLRQIKTRCSRKERKMTLQERMDTYNKCITELYNGIRISKGQVMGTIYPCNPFIENECNISNGALGIEFSLKRVSGKNTEKFNFNYTLPGLYTGAAGAMWIFLENENIFGAESLFQNYIMNNINSKDISLYSGMSGIGIALLKFYIINKNEEIMHSILDIEGKIDSFLELNDIKNIGLKFGRAGVSLFYLYLAIVTKEQKYMEKTYDLLFKELTFIVPRNDGRIDLPDEIDGLKASPYFLEGTAGLLAVIVRYNFCDSNKKLEPWIDKLATGIFYKQVTSATLFYGLSGIGNTLLDCYYYTGNRKYYDEAIQMADVCCLYKSKIGKDSYLVADVFNMKLSADLGYGAAGIMLFLNRIIKREKYNFCFF